MELLRTGFTGELPEYFNNTDRKVSSCARSGKEALREDLARHARAIEHNAINLDALTLMELSEVYLRLYGGTPFNSGYDKRSMFPFFETKFGSVHGRRAEIYRGGDTENDVAVFRLTEGPYIEEVVARIEYGLRYRFFKAPGRANTPHPQPLERYITVPKSKQPEIHSILEDGPATFIGKSQRFSVPVNLDALKLLPQKLLEISNQHEDAIINSYIKSCRF